MIINRFVIIVLIFVLSATFLSFYLLFSVNEYTWMHEMNDSLVLPNDENLLFKAYLFGVPTAFMLFWAIYYSFARFGIVVKTLSVIYSLAVITMLISNYPASLVSG